MRDAGKVTMAGLEFFVLAEILYYYLHDGEETLHGAIGEWWERTLQECEHRARVARTRAMIRNLPET